KALGAWEYKYVIRKSDRLDEFQRTLASHSADGWEYVGTETLVIGGGGDRSDLGSGPVLVFKRPTAHRNAPAGGVSGMGPGPGRGTRGIGGGLMGNPGGGLGIMGSGLGGGGLGGSGLGGGIGGFSGMPGRGSNAKPGTNTPTEGMKQLGDPAQGASNKAG